MLNKLIARWEIWSLLTVPGLVINPAVGYGIVEAGA